jgi:hypothetical protein
LRRSPFRLDERLSRCSDTADQHFSALLFHPMSV